MLAERIRVSKGGEMGTREAGVGIEEGLDDLSVYLVADVARARGGRSCP